MENLVKRLEVGAAELILVFLILVEVLDFLTIIPATLEYVEKVIAVMAMCYLFYKASITKITFGQREKNYDLMIVASFFLLSMKTIIGFLMSAAYEESIMTGFYNLVLKNAGIIEKTGFWIGGIILIVIAGFLVHEKIKRACILRIIREDKYARGVWQKIVRFLSIYIVLIAIFVVVFTLAIEWLAMTVDAPILMIILFFYLFVIVKRGGRMKTESFIRKVSESSEEFYERFISLFHSRKTITIAITGLLVLHLLIEIGNFIIPYTTGLLYPKYFVQLGEGHLPLSVLMAKDFAIAGTVGAQIGVVFVYILNVLAILMLFFGPAYAWAHFYEKKRVKLPNMLWLFFGSIAVFLMLPVLRIREMTSPLLLGADITTQQIPFIGNIGMALLIGALVMAIFYILGKKNLRKTMKLGFAVVFVYFGIYLYYFFIDLAKFYVDAVIIMSQSRQYFIAVHLFLFFVVTILFYMGGYLMFLRESYLRQKI